MHRQSPPRQRSLVPKIRTLKPRIGPVLRSREAATVDRDRHALHRLKIGKLRASATIVGLNKRPRDRSSRKIRHSCFIRDRYQNAVTPRELYVRGFTLISF